jgi:hypothetical protein
MQAIALQDRAAARRPRDMHASAAFAMCRRPSSLGDTWKLDLVIAVSDFIQKDRRKTVSL